MTNEERNTILYKKMFGEQEKYRARLLTLPPNEILDHTYEYSVREDILMALESNDLTDRQADALLRSPSPLADIFRDWEHSDGGGYMESIWDTVRHRADSLLERSRSDRESR